MKSKGREDGGLLKVEGKSRGMNVLAHYTCSGICLEVNEALSTGGTQTHKRLQTTLANHLELSKFLSVSPVLT